MIKTVFHTTIKLSVGVFLTSCSSGDGKSFHPDSYKFNKDTVYENRFNIEGVCEDGVKIGGDPIFNCIQDITFFEDGTVNMMVTDIINTGEYAIHQNIIYTKFNGIDVSDSMSFRINSNNTITNEESGKVWTLSLDD